MLGELDYKVLKFVSKSYYNKLITNIAKEVYENKINLIEDIYYEYKAPFRGQFISEINNKLKEIIYNDLTNSNYDKLLEFRQQNKNSNVFNEVFEMYIKKVIENKDYNLLNDILMDKVDENLKKTLIKIVSPNHFSFENLTIKYETEYNDLIKNIMDIGNKEKIKEVFIKSIINNITTSLKYKNGYFEFKINSIDNNKNQQIMLDTKKAFNELFKNITFLNINDFYNFINKIETKNFTVREIALYNAEKNNIPKSEINGYIKDMEPLISYDLNRYNKTINAELLPDWNIILEIINQTNMTEYEKYNYIKSKDFVDNLFQHIYLNELKMNDLLIKETLLVFKDKEVVLKTFDFDLDKDEDRFIKGLDLINTEVKYPNIQQKMLDKLNNYFNTNLTLNDTKSFNRIDFKFKLKDISEEDFNKRFENLENKTIEDFVSTLEI